MSLCCSNSSELDQDEYEDISVQNKTLKLSDVPTKAPPHTRDELQVLPAGRLMDLWDG